MNKQRNSTLELLRVLSMIGVLGLHYMNKSIGGGLNATLPYNVVLTHFLESICITSVNVFILISGYFMIYQKTTGLRKAIDLYLVLLCYYLPFYAVACAMGETVFSWKELTYLIVPFARGDKWFLETYILLLLFAPFLNTLITNLNKNTHLLLTCIWLMIFSVWSSFFPSPPLTDNGYGITNFVTLYLISSYIRKYVQLLKDKRSVLIAFLVFTVSVLLITISSFSVFKGRAWDYCYLFNITASTAIFYAFLNLPETNNAKINTVAALTYGVYISHSYLHFRNLIYHELMHTERFLDSPYLFAHFLICILLQFIVFAAFEYLRQLLWKPTVGKWLASSKALEAEQTWERQLFNN